MNGEGFVYVYPMQYKSQYVEYLNVATRYIRVPNTIISNNSG